MDVVTEGDVGTSCGEESVPRKKVKRSRRERWEESATPWGRGGGSRQRERRDRSSGRGEEGARGEMMMGEVEVRGQGVGQGRGVDIPRSWLRR